MEAVAPTGTGSEKRVGGALRGTGPFPVSVPTLAPMTSEWTGPMPVAGRFMAGRSASKATRSQVPVAGVRFVRPVVASVVRLGANGVPLDMAKSVRSNLLRAAR